jgi:hypothetical protein
VRQQGGPRQQQTIQGRRQKGLVCEHHLCGQQRGVRRRWDSSVVPGSVAKQDMRTLFRLSTATGVNSKSCASMVTR